MSLEIAAQDLSEQCFQVLRDLFEHESGIRLPSDKKPLVVSRLQHRLIQRRAKSFEDYCALLKSPAEAAERQCFVDALTTHETFFFRDPRQFQHLASQALPTLPQRPVRIWSAAASTGEEAYSLAMTLAETFGLAGWELLGSDISERVIEHAARGLYPQYRLDNMPSEYMKKYCRRGLGEYAGHLLVNADLRNRTRFFRHNLLDATANLGTFDVIFLRNVLIYFDPPRRLQILRNVTARLRPGGYLYIGNTESLSESLADMELIGNSAYLRKQAGA
ncbi:MAG: chemotaxis protein methyltransferase CheR [Proteobacteria bacterium]|nr:chemotaxis protein methyltransferase CheR [Pseudomonadota bacterium]